MAGTLNNLRQNIPPRARLVIAITVVVVIILCVIGFSRLSGSKEVGAGSVKLSSPPSTMQIDKPKVYDKGIFEENSDTAKIYSDAEKKEAQTALDDSKNKTSHLDSLKVALAQEEKKPEVKAEPKPNQDLNAMVEARRLERERLSTATQKKQANAQIQQNPWKSFLDEERKFAKDYVDSYITLKEQMVVDGQKVPKPAYEIESVKEQGVSAAAQRELMLAQGTQPQGNVSFLSTGMGNGTTAAASQAANAKKASGSRTQTTSSDEEDVTQEIKGDYPSERLAARINLKDESTPNVGTGEMFYSVLQIGVNTDEISPIRAQIVEKGKLEGAVLVGNPVRSGEKAVLEFDSLSLKGKTYSLKAVAMDPDTFKTGLADDVDNHTVERYSKLFAASFVEGFSDALSGTQTITQPDGSSSTTKDALPDAASQIKVGIGKVGERFAPIFEKEFDRAPTVTVEPNKMIILMFMAPLDLNKDN